MNKSIKLGTALGLMLLFGFAAYQLSAGDRMAQQLQEQYQTELLMYGASWCGVCARARQDFARQGLDYVELDVDTNAEGNKQFRQLGGPAVPLFVVNGKVVRGYDRQRIQQLLALSHQTVR